MKFHHRPQAAQEAKEKEFRLREAMRVYPEYNSVYTNLGSPSKRPLPRLSLPQAWCWPRLAGAVI